MTGDVCGIGCDPAVPPAWTGDFCTMFWAPASIVWRTPVVVSRCRIVTPARKGRRRYFQLASGRSSSWLAVRARDQAKSGIVSSLLSAHQLVSVCVTVILAPTAARAELVLLVLDVDRAIRTAVSLGQGRDPPRAARAAHRRCPGTPLPTPTEPRVRPSSQLA